MKAPISRPPARSTAQNEALADATAVELWNEEDAEDASRLDTDQLKTVVFSRDWTVETIISQIQQGNVDLQPDFQRRNAWRDDRRTRLVESFILNFPVPQVVLAEDPAKKKSYIVIDGKQRLLTIASLFIKDYRAYWNKPRFTGFEVLRSLNNVPLDTFLLDADFDAQRRQLLNADIRTTVVSGYANDNVLYNIFYRLNTGSVPLSSQELRQVLNRGGFAKFILERTDRPNSIWKGLGLGGPDARLRDVELLLRLVAWRMFPSQYVGNMKPFLDSVMNQLNRGWDTQSTKTKRTVESCLTATDAALSIHGASLGRKFKDGRYEKAINRAVFEVQVLTVVDSKVARAAKKASVKVRTGYEKLCGDPDFLASIEATTKSIENYQRRFDKYAEMLQRVTKVTVPRIHFGRSA